MKKYLLAAAVISALLAVSCIDPNEPELQKYPVNNNPPAQKERTFWASDMTDDSFYEIQAQWLAYNSVCEVWVENEASVTKDQAEDIAKEYKNNIYKKLMDSLGKTYNFSDAPAMNTMQYADFIGDGNGRLIILLLDIEDGYNGSGGYVAGYFYAMDFYSTADAKKYNVKSNECDMIYMDTYPSMQKGMPEFYKTLAHEMQHMMNFVTSNLYYANNKYRDGFMETWLDEGLSSAAEYLYSGKVDQDRVNWYNADTTGLIAKGDNFYMWENYYDEDIAATYNYVLNDYATVNIFFQWLRVHYKTDIYKAIFHAKYSDYKAISTLFTGNNPWETLLLYWYASNFIQNQSNDGFGYKNDPILKTVKAHYYKESGTTANLFPGEAVYSYASTAYTVPAKAGNIHYYGLAQTGINTTTVSAGNALLSLNCDTDIEGSSTSATVTGAKPSLNADIRASVNYSINTDFSSYSISAAEMLRRNGFKQKNIMEKSQINDAGKSLSIIGYNEGNQSVRKVNLDD